MGGEQDNDLLNILNAHGNDFLASFSSNPFENVKKRKRISHPEHGHTKEPIHEEWGGIDWDAYRQRNLRIGSNPDSVDEACESSYKFSSKKC